MARDWWVFAIRGVAALLFGILAFAWPETTVTVLVYLFGAYVLIDGISLLVALIRGDASARRHGWAVALMGIAGIVAGIVTFAYPDLTALTLLYFVAVWAIGMGTFQIVAAIQLRREIDGELWMVLGGVVSIVLGVLLVAFPSEGLISLVWLVALWSVVFGVASIALSIKLKSVDSSESTPGFRATAH
jgi:uncharacterized membrane protein HdeD (DUF308 family)